MKRKVRKKVAEVNQKMRKKVRVAQVNHHQNHKTVVVNQIVEVNQIVTPDQDQAVAAQGQDQKVMTVGEEWEMVIIEKLIIL